MKTAQMIITILISLLWVVAASAMEIQLQWDPNTEPDLAGYKVYYGIDGLANHAHLDVSNQTVATISGLDPANNYSFAVTAYNSSGLESSYSNIVTALELVPPSVSITNPSNNAKISNTVVVRADASDNVGVTMVEFYVNGILKSTDTAEPYQYSWDILTIAPGIYSITAMAYDAAGNVGLTSSSVNVVKDVTPPVISYSSPLQGSSVSGMLTASCNVSDDVGVDKVEFYVDGVMMAAGNATPYHYQWDTTRVSNGSYTLTANAYDAAGNIGQSSTVSVTVNNPVPDTLPPTVNSFTMPATATSLTVAISSFAATDNIGITGYLVRESAAAPVADTAGWSSAAPTSYTFTGAGSKTVYAWVKDAAGNVSARRSAAVTIIFDSVPVPATSVTLTSDLSTPQIAGPTIVFTATASGGSGPYLYQYWLKDTFGVYTLVQPFSSATAWNWATAGLPAGTYQVAVQAKSAGSTLSKGFDVEYVESFTISTIATSTATAVTMTTQAAGSAASFTATASGGSGTYHYQFWLKNTSGVYSLVQPYSSSNVWNWATAGLPAGTYYVAVQAKSAGSALPKGFDVEYVVSFVISSTATSPATAVTMTTLVAGSAASFTATASGGSGAYQYQFWWKDTSGAYSLVQAYSVSNVLNLDTTGLPAGNYYVAVQAKSVGSIMPFGYDVENVISYVVK